MKFKKAAKIMSRKILKSATIVQLVVNDLFQVKLRKWRIKVIQTRTICR